MAMVQIDTPQLDLGQARPSFIERWGEPVLDRLEHTAGDEPALLWIIGWLRIEGHPQPDGMRVRLVREDVQSDILQGHVERAVFDLLDGLNPAE